MKKKTSHPLLLLAGMVLLASCSVSGLSSSSNTTSSSQSEASSSSGASSASSSASSSVPSSSSAGTSESTSTPSSSSSESSSSSASKTSQSSSASEETSESSSTASSSVPSSSSTGTSESTSAPSSSSSEPSSSSSSASGSLSGKDGNGISYDATAFTIVNADTSAVPSFFEGVYTIDEPGTYTCSGTLVGMISIALDETDAGTNQVELDLEGVTMSYAGNSVIYCASGDGLDISAKSGTVNTITDLRAVQAEDEEDQGGGAIYSKVDTKLKGKGTLNVTGTYNNGIHVTKDLTIKNLTLQSKAINNAIKGTDSLTIQSGTVTAISSGGDGLKTVDSDVSTKLNQRGDVTILGGEVTVYSACDGIQAAHDFVLGDPDDPSSDPSVTIWTNKYSSYTNEDDIADTSSSTLYLRTKSQLSNNYRFAVYFNDGSNYVWSNASYVTSQSSGGGWGGRTTYYYYSVDIPSSAYTNFQVYVFNSSASNSTSAYVARSSAQTLNSAYDTVTVSYSGTTVSCSGWTNYSSGQQQGGGSPGGFPGGQEGNTDKADVSAKGVKAQNDIHVYAGSLNITAYDDGLHANYGETLDSGATSTGDVYIHGGTTTISASDDGVHADRYLRISGGTTTVTSAYEGLEGNQIYVTGGTTSAYASDDAVNAGSGSLTAAINVSGGYLFACVPSSGDVDGIDSNGTYTQTGGTVITCGPASQNASAFDHEGTARVSGGTLAILGGYEGTISSSGVTSSSASTSFSANKKYTIKFANGSITTQTLKYSYSKLYAYSELGSYSSVSAA